MREVPKKAAADIQDRAQRPHPSSLRAYTCSRKQEKGHAGRVRTPSIELESSNDRR